MLIFLLFFSDAFLITGLKFKQGRKDQVFIEELLCKYHLDKDDSDQRKGLFVGSKMHAFNSNDVKILCYVLK